MIKLSDVHDCKKCHNKMVAIGIDHTGITTCSYCGERVDYREWMRQEANKMKVKL